jgi:prepilin-type N-terminal cleavage/methylation domain-containing protein
MNSTNSAGPAIERHRLHPDGRKPDHDVDLKANGFSLIEMLVIIAIVGILAGMGVASYAGMTRKYNIDNQIRRIHADLSKVRVMALTKGRTHFVTLNKDGSYEAKDDNNSTVLRSNEALNLSTVTNSPFRPIALNGGTQIDFNSRGLCTTATPAQPQTICVYSSVTPRYDCVNVSPTRVTLGKLADQGVCSADNCKIQ